MLKKKKLYAKKALVKRALATKLKKIRLRQRRRRKKIERGVAVLKRLITKVKKEESLFYDGSEFSIFRPIKKHFVRMMKKQFLKYYLHLGLQRRQIHQGAKSIIWGFAGELAIIDPDLLVYNFRRLFKFMLALLLKNYRFCFVSHQLAPYFRRSIFIFKYHMVFDYWIPGTVSNYKRLSKQKVRKADHFLSRFPQVLIGLKLEAPKFYSVSKEARGAGIPMFSFFDLDIDFSLFNYYFFLNMRSLTSFQFCLFLVNSLIKRSFLVKKTNFLKKKKDVSKKNKAK